FLDAEIAGLLRLPKGAIQRTRPLVDLGVDSLIGAELKMVLEERLALQMSSIPLHGGSSLADLARMVIAEIRNGAREVPEDNAEELVRQHSAGGLSLSDVAKVRHAAQNVQDLR
ncbi:MAG: acyl carrier protein, partial [Pseudomonadota bacterium]